MNADLNKQMVFKQAKDKSLKFVKKNELKILDLRSDMMSVPPESFAEGLALGDLGVDIFGECSHTQNLESFAADLFQKESALFFPTGVMANLCAVMAHVPKHQEVIVGKSSHIFAHEGGGVSILGGIPIKTIDDDNGMLSELELQSRVGDGSFFSTRTGLICIENPHNDAAGVAHQPSAFAGVLKIARDNGIPVHLDGARIFNACAKFEITPDAYAREVDSLMFCLNKGLRAPAGALLLGTRDFIVKAKEIRKLVGGGICQPGVISLLGLNALRKGWRHLGDDNRNSEQLIESLKGDARFSLKPTDKATNIVYVYLNNPVRPAHEYVPEFEMRGIRLLANKVAFRAVFHSQMSEADVRTVSDAFRDIIK